MLRCDTLYFLHFIQRDSPPHAPSHTTSPRYAGSPLHWARSRVVWSRQSMELGVSGASSLMDGGEQPAAYGRFLILPEYLSHRRRQHQFADGGLGFGDAYLHSSVHFLNLLGHRQCSGIQIQVRPLQSQQFSPAQPCGQVQQEQLEVPSPWPA